MCLLIRFMHLLVISTGVRYGEATNPGPAQSFVLGTFNPTGIVGKCDVIQELPSGEGGAVWGVTETHMTKVGYKKFQDEMRFKGLHARLIHGAFAEHVSQGIGSYGGKSTGVAILSSTPARAMTNDWDASMFQEARIQSCACRFGDRWLKTGVCYGFAHNPHLPSTIARTDAMLELLTERLVGQSYGYRVIMGDFNHSKNTMPQFAVWRRAGWVELQEYALEKWGIPIKPTCRGVSTIDMVWVSPEMVPLLQEVGVDDSYFAEHSIVFGRFNLPSHHVPVSVWRKPLPLPWDQVEVPHLTTPCVERSVDAHMRAKSDHGLLPQQFGRCCTKEPKLKRFEVTPVRPSQKGTPAVEYHGENYAYTKWVRQLRRLTSLCKCLEVQQPSQMHREHIHQLWISIRGAPGFPHGFPKAWQHRSVKLPGSPAFLPHKAPSLTIARLIMRSFETEFRAFEMLLKTTRQTKAMQRRQQDTSVIFKDVKKEQALPVQTVVLKTMVEVVEIRTKPPSVMYTPPKLDIDEPVFSSQGMLAIQSHQSGCITLATMPEFETGEILMQDRIVADLPQVFEAFRDLWNPIWNRHKDIPMESWRDTISMIRDMPEVTTTQMPVPPLTTDDWMQTIQSKKVHSATGPDGVSRQDLLHLPPEATTQIVQMFRQFEDGSLSWPDCLLMGHITALEKHSAAAHPSEYRPICVLPMMYRTWASHRARQILAWLDMISPKHMVGNRPGHSTMDLWWELVLLVEQAAHFPDSQVCGFVTDVRKCFNTLPRAVIYACARKCGLSESLLKCSFSAVNRIQRCFIVTGSCSTPMTAETGFPEGDPLSVVAMACLNLVMHHELGSCTIGGNIISYVDNWEAICQTPECALQLWQKMQLFTTQVDISLDVQKSYMWASDPLARKRLRQGPLPVKLDARDLGGHAHYSRRNTMYTVRDRIISNQPLWGCIARSVAPVSQKLRLLPAIAWARCFYGVSIVSVGHEHAVQLRGKAMQALKWNQKGANPMIQLSLVEHPKHDPGFHMIWDSLQAFRRRQDHNVSFAVLDQLCAEPSKRIAPGPCIFLLERLHQLGWQWEGDGFIIIHDGTTVDLLTVPKQELGYQASQAWGLHVGSLWTNRDTFQGLQGVDRFFSMQAKHTWTPEKAAILRTALNGTFFTRDKQFHSGKFESKQCQWCDSEDSMFHRYWQCPHFQDLRDSFTREQRNSIMDLEPCTYLHGWFTHTELDHQLAECWHHLPSFTGMFEPIFPSNHDLHLFVDGGCHGPDVPMLKIGTWGVAAADLNQDCYLPVAQGFVRGRFHTSLRAELTAVIEAVAIGCEVMRTSIFGRTVKLFLTRYNRG